MTRGWCFLQLFRDIPSDCVTLCYICSGNQGQGTWRNLTLAEVSREQAAWLSIRVPDTRHQASYTLASSGKMEGPDLSRFPPGLIKHGDTSDWWRTGRQFHKGFIEELYFGLLFVRPKLLHSRWLYCPCPRHRGILDSDYCSIDIGFFYPVFRFDSFSLGSTPTGGSIDLSGALREHGHCLSMT